MVQRRAHQQQQGGLFKEGSGNSIPQKGKVWRDNWEGLDPLPGEGENEWEMWVPGGTEKDMEVETYLEEETGDERVEQIKADAQDMKQEIQRESRALGGQEDPMDGRRKADTCAHFEH